MQLAKKKFLDEEILEIAINSGAQDCKSYSEYHEITSKKEDFYKVKNIIEKKVNDFIYSGIEWRAHNNISINKEQNDKIVKLLEALDDDDDVQNTFINCNIEVS